MQHEFIIRSSDGLALHTGSPPAEPTAFAARATLPFAHLLKGKEYTASCLSDDGRLLAWAADNLVTVVELDSGTSLLSVAQAAEDMFFSPANSFLAVWHKGHFAKEKARAGDTAPGIVSKDIRLQDGAGDTPIEVHRIVFGSQEAVQEQQAVEDMIKNNVPRENLVIYDLRTGQLAASFFEREFEGWRPQWSVDEEYCVRLATNTIHLHKGRSFDPANLENITVDRIQTAVLFPKAPYHIATFVPERKDMPAVVSILELLNPEKVIASKSCFRAKEAQLQWCFDGSAVVAHTFDSGEHSLYLVSRGLQAKLLLDGGSISCVQWSPTIRQFLVVYNGTRKLAIFNIECDIVTAFEEGFYRKELVSYSPNGKYISLCRLTMDQKLVFQIREVKTKAVVWTLETAKQLSFIQWAPSSNFFVIGSHSPMVRGDNGMSVFNLAGKSICAMKASFLYSLEWRKLAVSKADKAASAGAAESVLSADDEKKLKALRRKAKEIEELKEKQDLGLELEDNQVKKIGTEAQVLKDIETLLKKTQLH